MIPEESRNKAITVIRLLKHELLVKQHFAKIAATTEGNSAGCALKVEDEAQPFL